MVKSAFEKTSRKSRTDNKNNIESFKVGDKVFFTAYEDGKETWEDDIIPARIGKLIYFVKGKKDLKIKGTIIN